jgi:hypothetical protein
MGDGSHQLASLFSLLRGIFMKSTLATQLFRLSTYLVKGFCASLLSLLVLTILAWVFGFGEVGITIFSAIFPWLLKAGIMIGCTLMLTSLSEGI